jgi:hypothetical protein
MTIRNINHRSISSFRFADFDDPKQLHLHCNMEYLSMILPTSISTYQKEYSIDSEWITKSLLGLHTCRPHLDFSRSDHLIPKHQMLRFSDISAIIDTQDRTSYSLNYKMFTNNTPCADFSWRQTFLLIQFSPSQQEHIPQSSSWTEVPRPSGSTGGT